MSRTTEVDREVPSPARRRRRHVLAGGVLVAAVVLGLSLVRAEARSGGSPMPTPVPAADASADAPEGFDGVAVCDHESAEPSPSPTAARDLVVASAVVCEWSNASSGDGYVDRLFTLERAVPVDPTVASSLLDVAASGEERSPECYLVDSPAPTSFTVEIVAVGGQRFELRVPRMSCLGYVLGADELVSDALSRRVADLLR